MPSNAQYKLIAKGKNMFEVFLFRDLVKEVHVSVSLKSGYFSLDCVYDPEFEVPTEEERNQVSQIARSLYPSTYYYYGGARFQDRDWREFLLKASSRLSPIEGSSPYFAHYGREFLGHYFQDPMDFYELKLDIRDFARFFYPNNLMQEEEKQLFSERSSHIELRRELFATMLEFGTVSLDFSLLLSRDRPKFVEGFVSYLETFLGKKEGEAKLIKIAERFPFINSMAINEFLLRENHGIGISFQALFPALSVGRRYGEIAHILLHSKTYRNLLTLFPDSPYLYYLSMLANQGHGEEAREIAKGIALLTQDPKVYGYLSPLFDDKERKEVVDKDKAKPIQYSHSSKKDYTFFSAELYPETVFSSLSIHHQIEALSSGRIDVDRVEKSELSSLKREIRNQLKYQKEGGRTHNSLCCLLDAANALNDLPSYKALFLEGHGAIKMSPMLFRAKSIAYLQQGKKITGISPYQAPSGGKKGGE